MRETWFPSRERAEGERRSRRYQPTELLQPSRADSGDGIELVDRAESTVLLPVVENLLRRDGADSWQRVELLHRGAVQMYRAYRRWCTACSRGSPSRDCFSERRR